jgi:hypothetical protein
MTLFLFFTVAGFGASAGVSSQDETAEPSQESLALIKEAWAIADTIRERIWPGWSAVAPEMLLLEDGSEFLIGPRPLPDGFTLVGPAGRKDWTIAARRSAFDPGLLATFPAFGTPATIVVGTPAATGLTPTNWTITLLHENFHQLQNGKPGYYSGTAALGLAEDENDGMWMLNYPFPYESELVNAVFSEAASSLLSALAESKQSRRAACRYLQTKQKLKESVSEKDYRYMSFQLWQEGMAEYTTRRVAKAAAARFGSRFAREEEQMLTKAKSVLVESGVLKRLGRVTFYSMGHLEGTLLDRVKPDWKARYFEEPFQTDSFFPCAMGTDQP